MARRFGVKRLIAALALAGAVTPAIADPITAGIAILTATVEMAAWVKAVLLVATMAYGDAKMRRERRAANAAAKAAYNSNLSDRYITALRAAPPLRFVYGRCWTGGDIVGVFTTDKQGTDDNGNAYTKPDAYKHIVVSFASHQSQAFHDIKLDGKSIALSALDANGWSTASEFSKVRKAYREFTLAPGASKTLPYQMAVQNAFKTTNLGDFGLPNSSSLYTLSNGNKTITNNDSEPIAYSVFMDEVLSSVRVAYKLGTDTQTADTYLTTLLPSKWTTEHRLRGLTYAVITLDLEDKRFQGGPPQITAELSGRLLYDTRTATTAWSDNNALVARDYLLNMCKVPATMIDDAMVSAAANACGTAVDNRKRIGGTITTVSKAKYSFNGVVTSDDSREATLDAIADSMAGWISQSAKWSMGAGTWTAPVMALVDDDLDGQIELVQGGTPMESLFNGVRGQFIPAGTAVPIDFQPYKNATFAAADGRARWKNVNMPFTDDEFIATSIARIITERARNGMVIRYPAKLKAWPLRIGERVTVTSAEYGFSAKTFRVTDWQFAHTGAVVLTLQEDAASAYDLIDEVTADPTPNTGLPNPFDNASLPNISGLALLSNASTLRSQTDGAVAPRIKVSWDKYAGPYVVDGSGYIWVKWRRVVRDAVGAWEAQRLPGDSVMTFIDGIADGDYVTVGVWAENSFGGTSQTQFAAAYAVGKTALPPNVTGFSAVPVPGAINFVWNECTDANYEETEIRAGGGSWAAGTTVFKGRSNSFVYTQSAPIAVLFRIKHWDKWGNQSLSEAFTTASSLSLNDTRNYDFTNGLDGWTNIDSVVTGNADSSGGTYGVFSTSVPLGTPAYPRFTPVDRARRYRVVMRVWFQGGSSGTFYAGVLCRNAAGTIMFNSGGSTHPYCAAAGVSVQGPAWRVFSGEISGSQAVPTATLDPNKFFNDTVEAAPMMFPYTGWVGGRPFIDYAYIEDITDAVAVDSAGFSAYRTWDFNTSSLEGFTTALASLSASGGALTLTATGTDPQLLSPPLSFSGAIFDKIRMRVRRTVGSGWQGAVFYSVTGVHGYSGTYQLTLPAESQPGSDWTILEWDVSKHATSASDWRAGNIEALRFDLSNGVAGDAFEIDWISIGRSTVTQDLTSVSNSQWVARGVTVIGDTAIKARATTDWDSDVYSTERYYGGCSATAIAGRSGATVMFGLNSDPTTDSTFGTIDYAAYFKFDGTLQVYESGVSIGAFGTYVEGDVVTVAYDGSSIFYLKNGAVFRAVSAAPGIAFYFDSSFFDSTSILRGMKFVPMSSNNWSSIGGSAKPSDNATADLTLVNSGNCTQQGNRIVKTSGGASAWDAGMHSRDGYLGGAACSIYVHNAQTTNGHQYMFGLNNVPATASYTDINFAMFMQGSGGGSGLLFAYLEGSSGNGGASIGTYEDNDLLAVTYDGYKARWYKNGAVIFEVASVDTTSQWHFDCSIAVLGSFYDRVTFRPLSMVSGLQTAQVAANAITAFIKTDYDPAEAAITAGASFAINNISTSSYPTAAGGAVVTMFTGKLNVRLPSASTISQITAQITVKVEGATDAFFPVTLAKADGAFADIYACNWAWNVYHAPSNNTWDYAIDVNLIPNVNFSGTGETVYGGVRTITMEFKR